RAPALGLRAGGVGLTMKPQTASPLEDPVMLFRLSLCRWSRAHRPGPRRKPAAPRRSFRPRLDELEARALPSTFTVLTFPDAGPGSLRQAILDGNAQPGADLIRFTGGLQGTIALTSGELNITDDLTVLGPGADRLTVSGSNASRVFRISSTNVSSTDVDLNDLTIADGRASDTAFLSSQGPVTAGGGILNN